MSEPRGDVRLPPRFEQGHPVYVIDPDADVRRSLHRILFTYGLISWPFSSSSDFLENLPGLKPAPIMIEVQSESFNGLELLRNILDVGITWPVIGMTANADIRTAVRAIQLGAIDILEKPLELEFLEMSLQEAMTKLSSIKNKSETRDKSNRLFELLSPRETKVMMALMRGASNKAAAYSLSLSVRTVEMHRAHALGKLKVKSMVEVIQLSHDAGITLTAEQ